jgi:hypothetical protein
VFCPRGAAGVVVDRDSVFEAGRSQVQGEIVSVPGAPKLFGKLSLLATSRIDPKCVSRFHLQEYSYPCKKSQDALKGVVFNPEVLINQPRHPAS